MLAVSGTVMYSSCRTVQSSRKVGLRAQSADIVTQTYFPRTGCWTCEYCRTKSMMLPSLSWHAVLQLLSPVSHPWVNQYMQVVGHPDLNGWDGTSPPMIGDVVSAVMQEFGRDNTGSSSSGRTDPSHWGGQRAQPAGFPTVPIAGQEAHGHYPKGAVRSQLGTNADVDAPDPVHTRRDPRLSASRRKPKDHTPIPAIPTKFNELQGMTTAQLSRLLEDDVARQALLLGMPSVVGMKELRTEVRKGNVETAKATIEKQEKACILRNEAERLRLTLKELQASYEGAQVLVLCAFVDCVMCASKIGVAIAVSCFVLASKIGNTRWLRLTTFLLDIADLRTPLCGALFLCPQH